VRITAVPLHDADLVRRGIANGFTLTEAFSPARRIPPHAHGSLSITMVLKGGFEERYRSPRRPHFCERGSVLIRPAGELHENHLAGTGARTLSLELSPARMGLFDRELAPLLTLAVKREAAFLDIGLALSRELRAQDAAAGLALESLSLELLARLARVAGAAERGRAPEWLARSRDSIHERFRDRTLRVADLAFAEGVHPVYFARAFRRHYRMTPGDYVRRLRLEWALDRVRTTAEPLASVALDCGFADQSHLTRAFRRRFGLSPGRLRRAGSS
jgi:AraC family transcriptional regulator